MSPDDAKAMLAEKLFRDKSVSIDDICTTLKISRSTLYRHVSMRGGRGVRA
jgi:AcrR family transcriptional regulator